MTSWSFKIKFSCGQSIYPEAMKFSLYFLFQNHLKFVLNFVVKTGEKKLILTYGSYTRNGNMVGYLLSGFQNQNWNKTR